MCESASEGQRSFTEAGVITSPQLKNIGSVRVVPHLHCGSKQLVATLRGRLNLQVLPQERRLVFKPPWCTHGQGQECAANRMCTRATGATAVCVCIRQTASLDPRSRISMRLAGLLGSVIPPGLHHGFVKLPMHTLIWLEVTNQGCGR